MSRVVPLLLLCLSLAFAACERSSGPRSAPAVPAVRPSPPWGGLQITEVHPTNGAQKGGTVVVMLHGWGADGKDLVPLAQSLAGASVRFVLPEAPLLRGNRGRAWWHLNRDDSPMKLRDAVPSQAATPSPHLLAARRAVLGVIETARYDYRPDRLCLLGFSQGAMLAVDVALSAEPPIQCVAVLSGALVADSVGQLQRFGAESTGSLQGAKPSTEFLVAHGSRDSVLPEGGARLLFEQLKKHGFEAQWLGFSGGHSIPGKVRSALPEFLLLGGTQ